jgi:polysaccharide deacetylase family sporulation protein PdaB
VVVWAFTSRSRRQLARAGILVAAAAVIAAGARLTLPQPVAAPAPGLEPLRTVPIATRELALTFDISWGQVMPPKVISILERDRVPATFFLSGPWVRHNPELVHRIAANDLFEIESHGEAHVNLSGLSSAAVTANLRAANEAIEAVAGVRPTLVRPPNGDYNARSLAATQALGMRTVIWGTDSLDWMNPGVDVIVRRVLKRAHPGDIVLLHASDTCKQTDLALPAILAGLHKEGYRLVTVTQLLKDAESHPPAERSSAYGQKS